ncbi:LysR family transcriptional regulator [Rhodococcus sp. IEGM 1381]|uniref:LysR family transcriptional regulator n=1 Tax=Rhodococcus sp. IEGM 1381 TaxID=3047085 RepID=UPI0024B85D96|nr:LysR family transcriptional regulator [Rhodococcus sp. IEGM 1381]MDI9897463.1 LysR family transcriptional regulator [Rhodococcus sp. IEGM 1381]
MAATDLTLTEMRAICEVARLRSFSAAARSMRLSQPSLSRLIRDAERAISTRLFERTTRTVIPTPICDRLLPLLNHVLSTLSSGLAAIDQYARVERGALSIATLPSIAAVLLPGILEVLHREHPNLEINIWDGPHDEVEQLLLSGRAEIALTTCVPDDARFKATPVWVEEFYSVSSDPEWARVSPRLWADFKQVPFVTTREGTSIRLLVDRVMHDTGIDLAIEIGAATVATLGGLIRGGLGVSALPALEITGYGLGDLYAVPLAGPVVHRTTGLVAPHGLPATPAAIAFANTVQRHAADSGFPSGVKAASNVKAVPG